MRNLRLGLAVALSWLVLPVGASGCASRTGTMPDAAEGGSRAVLSSDDSGGAVVGQVDAGLQTIVVGQVEGGVQTKLPALPLMTGLVAELNDDSATISFDPVEGALDYRVYPLPGDGEINVTPDGHVVVRNAIYRCAGDRETPTPTVDGAPMVPGSAIHTQVDRQTVGGYLRLMADATLGYVYPQPGAGLVPVYVLGEADANADSTCYFARWAASRVKKYTTSEIEKRQLLVGLARDDGIAFYVPAASDPTTRQIYTDTDQAGTPYASRYYFGEGPEASSHGSKAPAFAVRSKQLPGTLPLMRVFYGNQCGWSHDELAVGKERFNRIYKQGDTQSWWSLLWSGITQPTTLVIEALDTGCPFQGHLSPKSIPSVTAMFGSMPIVHQPFVTIDEVRAASPTNEAFVNGQHDPSSRPKAIARAFINVTPSAHAKMDFFANFSPTSTAETFTDTACGSPDGNCYQTWRQQSPTFDQMFISVESGPKQGSGLFAAGPVLGELWVTYADVAADTNGKYRLTSKQKGSMDSSSFLHVTMEVDAYTTARRYPQILISDRDAPVQYSLDKGHTLIVQSFGEIGTSIDWPIDYQIEVCNLRTWDVNDQCPAYDLHLLKDGRLAPNDEVGEHASVDHRIVFDVYASTKRTYLFLDDKPYACANMPSVGVPTGQVTITWGDVLYHSAVDHTFAFHKAHMQVEQRRHFDNLGFSSGVPAPSWDESRLPCAAPIAP